MNEIVTYLASGWFTPDTREILDNLEAILTARKDIDLYSPRRDGVMLPPNQKHDTALREKIFEDNISHIKSSDLIIANIYSGDNYNDPGTMYEIGYAMAHNIPIIGFTTSMDNINERFRGILDGISAICTGYNELIEFLDGYQKSAQLLEDTIVDKQKVLFVGNGTLFDSRLVSYIMDSGVNTRWISDPHNEIYSRIDEIFEGINYMIAVIDDRSTLVSWMIGQAYARGIPVVTYSNHNYGINVMLLISVLTHIRGTDELEAFLQQVSRCGLQSIPKFDISQLDSM